MDIGRAFTFTFEDKDWLKKVAIGGLVTMVPILNFVAMGYAVRTLRNVREGRELPLPEWDDWGGDFTRGLLLSVGILIYSLPGIAVILLGLLFSSLLDEKALLAIGYCPGILWSLLVSFVTPALWIQLAKENEFNALFRFEQIFSTIRDHLSDYIVAFLLIIVAQVAAGVIGLVLCLIGTIFTAFLASLVQAHLLGQVEGTPPSISGQEPIS